MKWRWFFSGCRQSSNSSWRRTVSKKRPGSIVTETLKNGILIPIDISKELNFYVAFKYKCFIKFSRTHQSYESEKIERKFGLIRTETISSSALFKRPENWRTTRTLPTLIFPHQNFETAILFIRVEKSNNYVFEDDFPHTPREKGCKLWTSPIVYI